MNIILKPIDTFFFRNHRDFEFGSSFIKGIFPPRLSTAYGALRSAYIYHHSNFNEFENESNEELKKWMGSPKEVGEFSIKGVFLYDGKQVILPLPLDYQVLDNVEGAMGTAIPLELRKDSTPASNESHYQLFGTEKEKSSRPVDYFIPEEVFKSALLDYSLEVEAEKASKWIKTEMKIGVALNRKRRTAEENMLYNMEFLRFEKDYENAGFLVAIQNGPSFENVTKAKFGGEGRPWNVEVTSTNILDFSEKEIKVVKEQIKETGVARIILLTPAIWEYGNRPSQWNKETNELVFKIDADTNCQRNITCKLLAVATSRPIVIGGWDIVNNRPKPRMNAIPAGTVLYVQVEEGDVDVFVDEIFGKPFTDYNAHEGYGFAVCGAGKIKK
ncbi:type III-B CRISPR module-associated protein Cmr3 [Ureibacillus thermosphaericus]|uniref:CRISPR-associated protein Cmr3 n=1 Tax=Ureibacillus thermosphaericus TaxID=51173 RepID=A0A840PT84_URETH|nr:type III-B CRISPR module-associated protein Cmr3 [Ureibacillus thermosphaericus]MBB5149087.1 CRISPR-associated protein Cmr3 [Ureibacillus thermosphaericus]NKZ31851.1 type III-B CRISPR module-associated protein Cmr3 [Ureibacillus thermosphaericus]